MAVIVKLTNTNKKRNSTKVITAFSFNSEAVLKQPTSVTDPILLIEADDQIIEYNYMYIQQFHRYYYIDDILSVNHNLWEIRASVDALASFKEQIGQNQLYILRSSRWKDGDIPDMYYPTTGEISAQWNPLVQTTSYTVGSNFREGCYVLGALGENDISSAVIGQSLYVLTPTQYRQLCHDLMDADSSYSWGGLATGLINSLFNPTDYITSCYWLPIVIGTTDSQQVYLGKWNTGITAGVLSGSPVVMTYQAGVPTHPQASRGRYLNMGPYAQYYLDLGYGSYALDSTMVASTNNINVTYTIDPSTGLAVVTATSEDGTQQMLNVKVNYGVPVNIATTKNNMLSTFTQVATGAAVMAATGNIASGVGIAADALIGGADFLSGGTISNAGGNGTLAAHQITKKLYARFFHVVEDDPDINGYPLCKVLRPTAGGIQGGYIKASYERLEISGAMSSELADIERYITEGFYFE